MYVLMYNGTCTEENHNAVGRKVMWRNQKRRKKIVKEFSLELGVIHGETDLPRKREIASELFLMENNLLPADIRVFLHCLYIRRAMI